MVKDYYTFNLQFCDCIVRHLRGSIVFSGIPKPYLSGRIAEVPYEDCMRSVQEVSNFEVV